jgi:predicted nucleic acid-binding protein
MKYLRDKYLLDVNALIALGFLEHSLHDRTATWVSGMRGPSAPQLLTCAITELGFVRVISQAPQYGFTVHQARTLLVRLTKSRTVRFGFLDDNHGASNLPAWATSSKQTTDGHLAELARGHDAILATLDNRIPGSFLIPL